MNDPGPPPPRRTSSLLRAGPGRLLLVVAVCLLAAPGALAGQAGGSVPLTERELEYRAALRAHEAAVAARQVVENTWRTALDSVNAARRSGDRERLDRAQAAFLAQTTEFERLDNRVRATEDTLTGAREALLDALDRRAAQLGEEADTARTPARRQQIVMQARDLRLQYQEIVREGADVLTPTPVFYPGILAYDPRDTPNLLRGKADLVERRVELVQTQLDEAGERIESLERLIRLRRQQENFNAPLDRFGDVQVPVVTGGGSQNQDEEEMADSAGRQPPTLEEQLSAWRLQEEQLGLLLRQLEENLLRFRARIGAGAGARVAVGSAAGCDGHGRGAVAAGGWA